MLRRCRRMSHWSEWHWTAVWESKWVAKEKILSLLLLCITLHYLPTLLYLSVCVSVCVCVCVCLCVSVCLLTGSTSSSSSSSCSRGLFQCVQSAECIHVSWRCDGDFDCSDNTDELGCSHLGLLLVFLHFSSTLLHLSVIYAWQQRGRELNSRPLDH